MISSITPVMRHGLSMKPQAVQGRQRKEEAEAAKKLAEKDKKKMLEDLEWKKGEKKLNAKTLAAEQKKQEKLSKKAEKEELERNENEELSKIDRKSSKSTKSSSFSLSISKSTSECSDESDFSSYSSFSIEADEEHEDKTTFRNAYREFEAKRLPQIKEENPTLRLSQHKNILQKEWKKSPENPRNQTEIK